MDRKMLALLLAGTFVLGLGVSAFAAEDAPTAGETVDTAVTEPAETAAPEDAASSETETPDPEETEGETEAPAEAAPAEPDAAGTLSFANLTDRARKGCLQYLILEESVARVEANDYEKMKEDLRDGLNNIANAQWYMIITNNTAAANSLQAQYDALRKQFDDLKDGKIQKEAADGIRQLEEAQNSILMLTEGMYIQLDALNGTDAALERALAALDRQIQELELRYQLGQISALTLQQAKAGRTSLVSQRQTLQANAASLNMNLEAMVGADLTGRTRLVGLPKVSAQELEAMDLENDLTAAKEASFTLYDAKKTLDDAEEDYKDAGKKYNYNEKKYEFVQARHTWQGAQYTYDSAVQSFELKFRSLYAQVKDDAQVLAAAKTALSVEKDNCAVKELKYGQGTISQNALLTAKDDVAAAQDKVDSAQRDLFSAYNNYCWAVEHGILN